MSENKIGSIVILNGINSNLKDNIPIGIVTKGDVVRAISGHIKPFSIHSPVQEVMSSPLITINPNSSIRNAMETMQQEGIRRLPVVDNGTKILGIITNKDIFSAMLKNQIFGSTFINDKVLVGPRPINIWQAYRLLETIKGINFYEPIGFGRYSNYRRSSTFF